MTDADVESLRAELADVKSTLEAIRRGEVDAVVIEGESGPQVFTLKGADETYRTLVESLREGAATLDESGTVLYANERLAKMLETPLSSVVGANFLDWVLPGDLVNVQTHLAGTNRDADGQSDRLEFTLVPTPRAPALDHALPRSIACLLSLTSLPPGGAARTGILVTDLTPTHVREAALQASEARYRSMNTSLEQRVRLRTAELEASTKRLDTMTYSIAQSLRTPLRNVANYANALQQGYASHLPQEAQWFLEGMAESIREMDALVVSLVGAPGPPRLNKSNTPASDIESRSIGGRPEKGPRD